MWGNGVFRVINQAQNRFLGYASRTGSRTGHVALSTRFHVTLKRSLSFKTLGMGFQIPSRVRNVIRRQAYCPAPLRTCSQYLNKLSKPLLNSIWERSPRLKVSLLLDTADGRVVVKSRCHKPIILNVKLKHVRPLQKNLMSYGGSK